MAPRRNIIIMALGFMVLFSAYNTLQNYATSLFPNGLGNQSLAVLYVVCAISVIIAPAIVDAWGPRVSMVVGAACYVAYMVSLIKIIPEVVLFMSAVIGFGAAILWLGNGVYITMDSKPSEYAEATSTFWAIFQVCNVAGNLITYAVFPHLSSPSALYAGFAVTGAVGTLGLMLVGPPASASASAGVGGDPAVSPGSKAAVPRKGCVQFLQAMYKGAVDALKLLLDWRLALIGPLFFLSGYELAYWTGAFPLLLSSSTVGLVLAAAGLGEVCGAYGMGWLSDRVGRTASLAVGTVLFSAALAISACMKQGWDVGPQVGGAPVGAFAAALGFGLGDSCFNTNAYAMCSQLHGNKHEEEEEEGGHGGAGAGSKRSAGIAAEEEEAGLLAGDRLVSVAGSGSSSSTSDPSSAAVGSLSTDGSASVGAFAVFQLLQNIGSAIGFYLGIAWPLTDVLDSNGNVTTKGTLGQTYLTAALLAASFCAFAVVDWHESSKAGKSGRKKGPRQQS